MEVKLKPCPFCGGNTKLMTKKRHYIMYENCGTDHMTKNYKNYGIVFYRMCTTCHSRGPSFFQYSTDKDNQNSIHMADLMWNYRRTSWHTGWVSQNKGDYLIQKKKDNSYVVCERKEDNGELFIKYTDKIMKDKDVYLWQEIIPYEEGENE